MSEIEVNLDQLDKALAEKRYHLSVMRLWAVAKDAGYSHKDIKTFTFSEGFLDKETRAKNGRARARHMNPPYSGALYHNAVRLKSGDLAEIPLMSRPKPPEHMRVSMEKKK